MDKLGKIKYDNPDLLYKYKGTVGVPALEMVDDIADIQKCGADAIKANAVVNTFIEHKKLTLSKNKCHKIHCGNKNAMCAKLKVHKEEMHETNEDKYLGDQINKNAKHASTITKRRAKGFGIISDIMQILDVIKDGPTRIRVGLTLRETWFINALCVNMEAWHNVLSKDIEVYTNLDHYLMRQILGAHSKVPIELLYLETSAIPMEYVIASRRINYLRHIASRSNSELVKRVYNAQRQNPEKGDWCVRVEKDMAMVGLKMSEAEMSVIPKNTFKGIVKKHVKSSAFKALLEVQTTHKKVRTIKYSEFQIQKYLLNDSFTTEQASTMFNIRANTVNGFKACFPSVYRNNPECKLGCTEEDTLDHVFKCKAIDSKSEATLVRKESIFGNEKEQNKAVTIFMKRHATRTAMLTAAAASQGLRILDTSTPAGCAGARTGT
jgi:hypothetical protein